MEKDIMFKMFFKCTIDGEQNLILIAGLKMQKLMVGFSFTLKRERPLL